MMSTCGMNTASKNMDFLTKHWAPFRRKYPSLFRLVSSDFIPEKSGWVRTRFGTCNFSIILRGEGRFERAGKSWPVQAPCVITQWPGESVAYGPTSGTWSEWYLVYNRAQFRRFREHHLVDPARPVWPIADPASLRMHLAEFRLLARSADPAWEVDRVDRIAERAILDTWLPPGAPMEEDSEIRTVAAELRGNLSSKWDFAELAARHGFSTTTFRRRWSEAIGLPPARAIGFPPPGRGQAAWTHRAPGRIGSLPTIQHQDFRRLFGSNAWIGQWGAAMFRAGLGRPSGPDPSGATGPTATTVKDDGAT